MFRNVRFYRVDGAWPDSEDELSGFLEAAAFEACGPFTERSSGFMPVDADSGDLLARRVNGADLLKLRSQSRLLPHAVIAEALEARIEEYRARTNEPPSPREKRRLKAETRDELLPKAMLKSDRIWGYVDLNEHILGIGVLQESAAERFLRRLQLSLDGVTLRPLSYANPVDGLLAAIFIEGGRGRFSLGRECRMQDPGDPGSVVRWVDFDLTDGTIRNHVANGMRLTHLAVVYEQVLSFVLDENGMISKMRFLGMDDVADDHGDSLTRLDAEFALVSGTLRQVLSDIRNELGGLA